MGSFISKLGQALEGIIPKRGRSNDGDAEIGAVEAVKEASSIGNGSKVAEWVIAVGILYSACAFQLAVQSLPHATNIYNPLVHVLALAVLLSFTSLVVAELVKSKFQPFSHFLHQLAVILLIFCFYTAISIPFPLYFKLISLFLFIISLSLFLFL